jgi:hypothetical protein
MQIHYSGNSMKTYPHDTARNSLNDRQGVAESLLSLLSPCGSCLVNENTGLFLGNTQATYSSRGSLLEGWSRLLWGLAPLQKGGFSWKDETRHLQGLIQGTEAKGKHYWGDVQDYDQRMVEMAAIALSLLLCPETYWESLRKEEKDNLITWLNSINTKKIPQCNWLYFRVLVNLAFEKLGRAEYDKEQVEKDFATIDSWYAGDGWYVDEVQFDYYNPFAFQYYSLIYYAFKKDEEKQRCNEILQRVKQFANEFIYYCNEEGGFVPYGRSLTYRFGMSAFFSACAFANIEVFPWGVMKGIVLRNLRWWFSKPILDRDGLLTIGYVNPSLLVADYYNAPGSPYWGLKTYLILALGEDHPFWTSEELPLPVLAKTKCLKNPKAILQKTEDDDTILLNGGQYPLCHHMHVAEKYAKFAYSIHYGFSVSSSYYDFEKCGCDSMLYFSEDGTYWRMRRESQILHLGEDYLCSLWHPYKDVTVKTFLVPYGNYHVRVHEIESKREVYTREGGFAIELYRGMERESEPVEMKEDDSSLVIEMPWDSSMIRDPLHLRNASSVRPTPNINVNFTTTIVPVLSSKIEKGSTVTYITLVGAYRTLKGREPGVPKITFDSERKILYINNTRFLLYENV